MNQYKNIETIFAQKDGVLNAKELYAAGISYYVIRKLIDAKKIERIKQGVYRWLGAESHEWVEVQKIVPLGVFCLFSASMVHELGTFIPSEYHIAIPWKSKVIIPEYPPIKLYYWQEPQYYLGSTRIQYNGRNIKVYDREKTVCDFIKFRNKVGTDKMKEIIKNYLETKDRNLNKLMTYARKLGISSVAQSYLEILL